MFSRDLIVDGSPDSYISVETVSGVRLFWLPKNAWDLYNENFWKLFDYLDQKGKNIVFIDGRCDKFIVVCSEEHYNFCRPRTIDVEYVVLDTINDPRYEFIVRNIPIVAGELIESADNIMDRMSMLMQYLKTINHRLWQDIYFATTLIQIGLYFIVDGGDNTLLKYVIDQIPKKTFRYREVCDKLLEGFHEFDIDDIKKFNIPKHVFLKWFSSMDVFSFYKYKIWDKCIKYPEDFKPGGFMSRYINVESIGAYITNYMQKCRSKPLHMESLPQHIREHPDVVTLLKKQI